MRLIEPAFLLWGLLACGPVLRGAGVTYLPPAGAGNGKHIVLVAGDDEYHSEEALPQLAKDPCGAPRFPLYGAVHPQPGRWHH